MSSVHLILVLSFSFRMRFTFPANRLDVSHITTAHGMRMLQVLRMVVSTYQAASGAGAAAMEELVQQTREVSS